MLKHAKGDLLKMAEAGEFNAIVHGCNCFNTMGSGIARQIREQYPDAYAMDAQTTQGDYNKLGNYTLSFASTSHPYRRGPNFIIINAYTQYDYNRPSERQDMFEYEAFQLILKKLLHSFSNLKFGFPYIGMGLAGGDKKRIIGMLEWFGDEVETRNGSATLVEFA